MKLWRFHTRAVVAAGILLLLAACTAGGPPPTPTLPLVPTAAVVPIPTPVSAEVVKDIPYTSERSLDVCRPIEAGPWPVVVLFHGGGMTKASVGGLCSALAERGLVVLAPTWRSSAPPSDAVTPGWEDAACAIRFARAKAAEYGGNPARVIAVGHSAGGAVGATMALAGDDFSGDCLVSGGSAMPDGFVGLDGAYNIQKYALQDRPDESAPEQYARITPYTYVNRTPIRTAVEFHLFVGVEDELLGDALAFRDALQTAGYPVTLARLPGVDHLSMSSGSLQETVGDIVDLAHR